MSRYEQGTAVAVLGFAIFQIADLWNKSAPSLSELREAPTDWRGDGITAQQKLMDADLMVGSVVAIVAVASYMLTKDYVIPLVVLLVFGVLSYWSHQVRAAEPR